MTPEQLAKSGTESAHQRAVFAWCVLNLEQHPELALLFHIPNGGSRGSTERDRAIRGANMKADGVKAGVSDLFLPVSRGPWHGLFIEMKKPGEKAQKNQKEFGDNVQAQGYGFAVCDHWEKAVAVLVSYLEYGGR